MAWKVKPSATVKIDRRERPYLTDEIKHSLEETCLPRYERKRGALLPVLHAVQEHVGYLPLQALEEIADFLELTPAQVIDTATFYEEFWLQPKGDYVIGVCRSIACEVCGYQAVLDAVSKKLGIGPGETTADGKFTLIEMECLGSCGTAPVALVNEDLQEGLTPDALVKLIDELPDIEKPELEPEPQAETVGAAVHMAGDTDEIEPEEAAGDEQQP